jgi:adenine-specific DNA-methyltransferase
MPEDKKEKELLAHISDLELQIKKLKDRKRYGLVWEDKKEKFDKDSEEALPILREKGNGYPDIITDKNKDFNILIEGDNYHSLSVLSYTHKNKVDVIYIDPPYNTGNKDFVFNDYFVDKDDRYRHSKWLSFMAKRLKLAKGLLSKNGVMFISIDDNEFAGLKILVEDIFGQNKADVFVWRKSGDGRDGKMKNTTSFRKDHEYILVVFKREQILNKIIELPNFQNEYGNPDNDKRGAYKAGSISNKEEASDINHENYYTVKSPSGKKFKRQFNVSQKEFLELDKDGRIYWGKERDAVPAIKIFINEERSITPYSVFLTKGTTTEGKKELREIFNIKDGEKDIFDNPKPSILIRTLIQLASNVESIVLDFFAGSGTTAQAVFSLNKKDDGNRKFILCTNNENKICENITYERIKRVSAGYKNSENKKVAGLGGNLKYLKTDFVKLEKSVDSLKHKIVDGSTEILCLKEGSFDLIADSYKKNRIKIFQSQNRYTAILFDLFYFEDFIEQLKKLKDKPVSVYVFSYTKDFSKEEFGDLGIKFTIEPIPEKILETYKKIFNF